ncbi:hypothetical protein WJX81_002712 [Elliptochloris bilobata]|uniref:Uncharacterized protein n=1 Tax=Elliptochloris bilobata TaxID=381761 RepID=A0AAW1SIH4_9CHLO
MWGSIKKLLGSAQAGAQVSSVQRDLDEVFHDVELAADSMAAAASGGSAAGPRKGDAAVAWQGVARRIRGQGAAV